MDEIKVTEKLALDEGLTSSEYKLILDILGRTPTYTELGMFMSMWSEHCSYKSSRYHLKKLPQTGKCVIQGPGENAGVIDIGDGCALIFKIESHNHPSFVEPYQGAATGVGGIIRDIFTMGARPLAILDSLKFGPLNNPQNRYIFSGVISGIAGYGNCIGIPTIGGDIYFEECYSYNPLVNVFCLGVAPSEKIFYGKATGTGNLVVYIGAKTGKDGIHGASLLASAEFDEKSLEMKPTVQVGDPFSEKMLMEACLELMDKNLIIGIQDMGAAGLTCSICEMSSRGNVGMDVDISLVPLREKNMSPYEIMLSESQERMLLVISENNKDAVFDILEKWELDAVIMGKVTADGLINIKMNGKSVVNLPALPMADEAPSYQRPSKKPLYLDNLPVFDIDKFEFNDDIDSVVSKFLSSPEICSKSFVYSQYDHMVRTNTVALPGIYDASAIRIKGTDKIVGMSVDCNPIYCYLDPEKGAKIAVAECARNLATSGFKPLAITNCLNFGNPEDPEVMWQFINSVDSIAEACRIFDTPVTGGNVSFYNETKGEGIFPTPVIGMVGISKSSNKLNSISFKNPGDLIIVLGKTKPELGGSFYLKLIHNIAALPIPAIDLEKEKRLIDLVMDLTEKKLIESAHDISEGGLLIAALESSFASDNNLGFELKIKDPDRSPNIFLFSESQGRILVTIKSDNLSKLQEFCIKHSYHFESIGEVVSGCVSIEYKGKKIYNRINSDLKKSWEDTIPEIMNS